MPTEKSPKSPKCPNEGVLGLSASEARILVLAITCCTEPLKIDFDKLASKSGYTAGSTKTIYGNARRKLLRNYGDESDANPVGADENGSPKAKKRRKSTAGRKRKRAQDETEATDHGEEEQLAGVDVEEGVEADEADEAVKAEHDST